jgi:hypothetical protein
MWRLPFLASIYQIRNKLSNGKGKVMLEIALSGVCLKIVVALLALGSLRLALLWFDHKMEFKFKDWINGADSHSIAIYYAGRFIGACILFGFIFS